MKKIYVFLIVLVMLVLLLFSSFFFFFGQGCTQIGCGHRTEIAFFEALSLEEGYEFEININGEKRILTKNNYEGGFFLSEQRVILNNDFLNDLEKKNKLDVLNIEVRDMQNDSIVFFVENHEFSYRKYYPNGRRCEPTCYSADTIYLSAKN